MTNSQAPMIVVLDTTVLVSDPNCSGLAWKVLVHACQTWNVRLVVPEVVLVEAVAGYRRRLGFAVEGLENWKKKQRPLGLEEPIDAFSAAVDVLGEKYAEHLTDSLAAAGVSVLAPPQAPHIDLVNRAAKRIRPCDDKGDGYRDTLNWLLMLNLAASEDCTMLWVSENSKDFADENRSDLHEDLLSEARDAGCNGRVTWVATLGDAALQVAKQFGSDEADLRRLHSKVRDNVLRDFLDRAFAGDLPEREVSPRLVGLPVGASEGQITGCSSITHLTWDGHGSVVDQRAILGFVAIAEVSITFVLPVQVADADAYASFVVFARDAGRAICGTSKVVEIHGLLAVDDWERPYEAEVTRIQAPADDPGWSAWKVWDARNPFSNALRAFGTPVIPPELLKGLMFPVIPPDFFKQIMTPVIPPDFFKQIMTPVIPPDFFKQVMTPVIPPDFFKQFRDIQRFTWPDSEDNSPSSEESDEEPPSGDGSASEENPDPESSDGDD